MENLKDNLLRIGLMILQSKRHVKLLNRSCVETVVYTEDDFRNAFRTEDIIAVG